MELDKSFRERTRFWLVFLSSLTLLCILLFPLACIVSAINLYIFYTGGGENIIYFVMFCLWMLASLFNLHGARKGLWNVMWLREAGRALDKMKEKMEDEG